MGWWEGGPRWGDRRVETRYPLFSRTKYTWADPPAFMDPFLRVHLELVRSCFCFYPRIKSRDPHSPTRKSQGSINSYPLENLRNSIRRLENGIFSLHWIPLTCRFTNPSRNIAGKYFTGRMKLIGAFLHLHLFFFLVRGILFSKNGEGMQVLTIGWFGFLGNVIIYLFIWLFNQRGFGVVDKIYFFVH